jgi:hypothetical protein
MELIGSRTEHEYREELLASRAHHFVEQSGSPLSEALRLFGYDTRNAYVLQWTPAQGEDLFTVLVDGVFILLVDLPRPGSADREPQVVRQELADYLPGLSRMHQIRLCVARELARRLG